MSCGNDMTRAETDQALQSLGKSPDEIEQIERLARVITEIAKRKESPFAGNPELSKLLDDIRSGKSGREIPEGMVPNPAFNPVYANNGDFLGFGSNRGIHRHASEASAVQIEDEANGGNKVTMGNCGQNPELAEDFVPDLNRSKR